MNSHRLRILMLAEQYPPAVGGGGSHAYYLSRQLTFSGRGPSAAEVLVLTAYGPQRTRAEDDVPHHDTLRIHPMPFSMKGKVPYALAVEGAVHAHRNFQPDVVHGQHLAGALVGLHVRAVTGTPLVVTLHKTPLEIRDKSLPTRYATYAFMKMLVETQLVSMFVAGSRAFQDDLDDLGVAADRRRLIPHGIPYFWYASHAYDENGQMRLRELLRVDQRQRVVLCPSRLDPRRKEVHVFLKAGAKLATAVKHEDFVFVVTGVPSTDEEASYRTDLETLAHKLGIAGHVRFLTQPVPFGDMPALNAISAATVLPSRIEGLGPALIEAMAVKVPVIGSNVKGIDEVIEIPEEQGMRYTAGDDEDLAKCLIRLFSDEQLRNRLRRGGFSQYNAKFTAERMAQEHLRLYEDILNERAGRSQPFT